MLLYTNSNLYNYRNIIIFLTKLVNFKNKNKLFKNKKLFNSLNIFFFKYLMLDSWKNAIILDFYKNKFANFNNFFKFNFFFIFFYLNQFLKKFNKIMNILYFFGVNKRNIFFVSLSSKVFNFNPFYSFILKKKKYFFKKYSKFFNFKLKNLYKFKKWFYLKKFLEKKCFKIIICLESGFNSFFFNFLKFLKLPIIGIADFFAKEVFDYSVNVLNFSTFHKILLYNMCVSSYLLGFKK